MQIKWKTAALAILAFTPLLGAGGSPDITDPSTPIISLAPVEFNAISNASFTFQNTGNADLSYSVVNSAPWLRVTSGGAGVAPPGGVAQVNMEAICGDCVGTRSSLLEIESNDPDEPTKHVLVNIVCPLPPPPARAEGDPHLVTLDGLAYDFQGAGDYFLSVNTSGSFVVQSRLEFPENRDDVTSITELAMLVADDSSMGSPGENIVRVLRDSGTSVDGVALPDNTWLDLPASGGTVLVEGLRTRVQWPTGEVVVITREPLNLDVSVLLPSSRHGAVGGLLGDFDGDVSNDIAKRNGVVLSQPVAVDELFTLFGSSWSVPAAESLFDTSVSPSPAVSTFLVSLPQADVAEAKQDCVTAGLTHPALIDACALDILLTQAPPVVDACTSVTVPVATMPSCCKVCRVGKACGNSCIHSSYTCHKGAGCACNAWN